MRIDWRFKSLLFSLVDILSAQRVLYFAQKHITKRARVHISTPNECWLTHRTNLQSLPAPHVLEFGAGQNLAQNIYLSRWFRSQVVVDLFPMLDLGLVNEAVQQLGRLEPALTVDYVSRTEQLRDLYRIQYLAPLDLRESPFADDEFDACISTNTLEHIPKNDIVRIFTELRRVLRRDGLVSAVVDYSDHYAHTDHSIGRLNYLRFTSARFSRYNHSVHYQNRLRHADYRTLFLNLGYAVLRDEALEYCDLPSTVAPEFDMTSPTLCATTGIFLLRNRK